MSETGLRVMVPPRWNPEQVMKQLDIPETLYRTLGFEESQPYRTQFREALLWREAVVRCGDADILDGLRPLGTCG